jgi:hypothetical protein
MSVWIIAPSEPIPKKTKNRIFREGKICDFFLKRKKKVTWFASSFNHHQKKKYIFKKRKEYLSNNYSIHYLKSLGYKKNFSFRRLLDHLVVGLDFFIFAIKAKKPEIIIASYPPIETAFFATCIARLRNIRIVIDYRDAWPDTFLVNKNFLILNLLKVFLMPYFAMRFFILRNAEIITISKGFSRYLLKKFNTKSNYFYLSSKERIEKKESNSFFIKKEKIKISSSNFNIVFLGNYNENKFNFNDINLISEKLSKLSKKIKIYLFGEKSFFSIKTYSLKQNQNIFYLDWINNKEIDEVLKISHVGLAPYKTTWDFKISIPNKISEYLSAGLPVIHSLRGETKLYLEDKKCGFYYQTSEDLFNMIKNLFLDKKYYKKYSLNSKKAYQLFSDKEFKKNLNVFFSN